MVAVSTTPIEPATPNPLKTFGNTVSAPSDVVHWACGWLRPAPVGSLSTILCSALPPGSSIVRNTSRADSGSVDNAGRAGLVTV